MSLFEKYKDYPVVWCTELRRFAYLTQVGAFFSTVVYFEEGIEYEDQIENDEYKPWSEHATSYESE